MTLEDIFEEGKKRYPVGTKFKVVHTGGIRTVKSHDDHGEKFIGNHINFLVEEGDTNSATIAIRSHIKNRIEWAEIVNLSKDKTNNYEIY